MVGVDLKLMRRIPNLLLAVVVEEEEEEGRVEDGEEAR
jgi:hypothetical protein